MPSIEVTRRANLSTGDQLAEMRAWLDREGIRVADLRPLRILHGRAIFGATFVQSSDAERFREAFDQPNG
jgi:hypothetical protein